jgi:hypothetical protein
LRLRTFCDLKLAGEIEVIAPSGCELASEQELLGEISRLIPDCKHLFSDPAVTELQTKVTVKDKEAKKGKKGKTAAEEATDAGEDEE